jgi:hypothetical protein
MAAFEGSWTYRSYVNDPDQTIEPNQLLFGMGRLVLTQPEPGKIGGSLGGTGWSLDLSGDVTAGDPARLRWQGRGEIGGEMWVYDYLGYVVPDWPNGVDQTDAIVGTIVRTEPHSNGQAPAGVVASWIAVRA